jgi:DNA-3-methyladenine glycosylase
MNLARGSIPARLVLAREFYDRDPICVARELLGKLLVRRTPDGLCAGRIVETEAYLAAGDTACHSYRGKKRKNATMFGRPGVLYVYPIHSRYCMNAVTEGEGVGSAVLIRSIEPLAGIELMQRRRGRDKLRELVCGPARLCEAIDVDWRLDGWDLTVGTQIWIAAAEGESAEPPIAVSRRIGVTSAEELELRFFYAGNSFVSGPRRAQQK